MDVHKESVRIAVLKGTEKQTVYEATVKNDVPRIVKLVGCYKAKGTVIAGYEAGCLGYTLQRSLAAAKVDCRVIAPNKVPRLGNERIKTDARDAILIEILSIIVDWEVERFLGQAAAPLTRFPFTNLIPASTRGMYLDPSSLRHPFSASLQSL